MKQSIRPSNTKKVFSGVGDFVSLLKSKKERVKKLSAVGREMGCDIADREDGFGSQSPPARVCTSKRFKVPLKFFDDCNGVDHASVPRKLRSAMKKRNRDSISLPSSDSKKLNRRIDEVESSKGNDSKKPKLNKEPISKDEEEVAETLFALAGMFHDNEGDDKNKLGESSEAFPSALPDAFEASVVSKEECSSRKADTVEPSVKAEIFSQQTVKTNSMNNHRVPMNLQEVPFSSKNEPSDKKTLCNSLHSNRGLEQQTSLPERSPELAKGLSTSLASQLEQHLIKESKKNGLALWPGLSSITSEPIVQSSTSKLPAWMKSAPLSASTLPLFDAASSNDKVSEYAARKKSWKKCAAHVYITRLIQTLQSPERTDNEGPKRETVPNGSNGMVSATKIVNPSPEKDLSPSRSVLQQKNLYRDPQHNQSIDFFSLSSGGGGVEANNGAQRCHKGSEPISRFQAPSQYHLAHHHSQLPLNMSQARYSSSTYPARFSSATQQLQLPHYHTNPTNTPYQLQQSYQQHQHRLWAAQYRQAATSMPTALLQNWQSVRHDPSTALQSAHPSPELLGSKYIPISPQQQQFMGVSSPARNRMQDHRHIPSGGALPLQLQLLCNERL